MGMVSYIREEIAVIRERDPAIKTTAEVFLYPSFKAILHYRAAHKLYQNRHYFLARWISQRAVRKTGIEIHPGAVIGKGLFIDHGSGVIIGETAVIGDNVTLYQGVTLGGTGKEKGKRHPTLEDNVMVSAGAKILGSFTIGENAKIGAGSVVLREVPPNCTVVGVPGRIVRMGSERIPRTDLDQIHLPDPVLTDIHALQEENLRLKNQVMELKQSLQQCRLEKIPRTDLDQIHLPDPVLTDIHALQEENLRLKNQVMELKQSLQQCRLEKEEKKGQKKDGKKPKAKKKKSRRKKDETV